jgi:DNA ligase (NAD+)
LLFALGIRHVGESTAKTLADWLGSLALIRRAPAALFAALPDIGGVVAQSLADFFAEANNEAALDALLQYVSPADEHAPSAKLAERLETAVLLARLDIPRLTEVRSQQLAAQVSGLEQLARMERRQLLLLQLPAEVINALADWLDVPAQRSGLQALSALRDEILAQLPSETAAAHPLFDGKTFVLTGTLPTLSRDAGQGADRSRRWQGGGQRIQKTHFVVAGAEAGSKLAKAEELGIAILDEAGLQAMLQQPQAERDIMRETAFERGNRLAAADQQEQAIAAFSSCLQHNPQDWQALFNRGTAHMRLKQYPQALEDYLAAGAQSVLQQYQMQSGRAAERTG